MTKTVRQATWGPVPVSGCQSGARNQRAERRRTQVLDDQLGGLDHARLVPDEGPAVLEDLLGGRVEQADAVEVGEARLAGDGDLGVLDGGIVGQLDRRGQLLDGLFGRPVAELERERGHHGCSCKDVGLLAGVCCRVQLVSSWLGRESKNQLFQFSAGFSGFVVVEALSWCGSASLACLGAGPRAVGPAQGV